MLMHPMLEVTQAEESKVKKLLTEWRNYVEAERLFEDFESEMKAQSAKNDDQLQRRMQRIMKVQQDSNEDAEEDAEKADKESDGTNIADLFDKANAAADSLRDLLTKEFEMAKEAFTSAMQKQDMKEMQAAMNWTKDVAEATKEWNDWSGKKIALGMTEPDELKAVMKKAKEGIGTSPFTGQKRAADVEIEDEGEDSPDEKASPTAAKLSDLMKREQDEWESILQDTDDENLKKAIKYIAKVAKGE